jgi:hypothetical protein
MIMKQMEQKTINWILMVGLAVVAIGLIGATFREKVTGTITGVKEGSAGCSREEVTEAYQRAGWGALSQAQQRWTRELYIRDLRGLVDQLGRRRLSYAARGLQKHVVETEVALQLLQDCLRQVSQPGCDVVATAQPLINDVVAALAR